MSVIDRIVAAVTPPESEEDRARAREKARTAATAGDWLATTAAFRRRSDRLGAGPAEPACPTTSVTKITGRSVRRRPGRCRALEVHGQARNIGVSLYDIRVRGPGCKDRAFHLRLHLGMIDLFKGSMKMGEGHGLASFLPILSTFRR